MKTLTAIACVAAVLVAAAPSPYALDWRQGETANGVTFPPCHHAMNPAQAFEVYYPMAGPVLRGTGENQAWNTALCLKQVGTLENGQEAAPLTGTSAPVLNLDRVEQTVRYYHADGISIAYMNNAAGLAQEAAFKSAPGTGQSIYVDFTLQGNLHAIAQPGQNGLDLVGPQGESRLRLTCIEMVDGSNRTHEMALYPLGDGTSFRVTSPLGTSPFPFRLNLIISAAK